MAKNLVIVESPTKVKTIKKFLGANYEVEASNGHVRDLPRSSLGIDIENDFEPKYITIRGKGELLAGLRKAAKKADKIFLATDPDREGEAISWHLQQALKIDLSRMRRITFNEITKTAVKASLKAPRDIDMNLVDEQQARRCLDRMVGYEISPLLWKKIKRGLSAGRVQSVALRIIADREEQINNFIPEEYWTIEALLRPDGEKKNIKFQFYGEDGKKTELKSKKACDDVLEAVSKADFFITDIKKGERSKKAPLPFTTSTLQQDASRLLNFSTQKTMRVAQQLYEGIDIKGKGSVGLISYLRTDSTRISKEADAAVRDYIGSNYGEKYLAPSQKTQDNGKRIQDAHEAIRPTDVKLTPVIVKDSLSREQFRLYQLIWKRFVASRMTPAVYAQTRVRLECGTHTFTAAGSKKKFDGFLSVYKSDSEEDENKQDLSFLKKGDEVVFASVEDIQHFTEPPAHYTEASLVRALEEDGIGRPSTYAPTITTLLARNYVTKEKKNLYVTELGIAVNELMVTAFPNIVDTGFTARMESELDKVAEGQMNWKKAVGDFYPDLESSIKSARENLGRIKVADQVTDVICDKCGRNMVIKYGPHGKFLACPGFPECRNTKPLLEKIGMQCPKCGAEIVKRRTKKGRLFYACENQDCDFVSWRKPTKKSLEEAAKAVNASAGTAE